MAANRPQPQRRPSTAQQAREAAAAAAEAAIARETRDKARWAMTRNIVIGGGILTSLIGYIQDPHLSLGGGISSPNDKTFEEHIHDISHERAARELKKKPEDLTEKEHESVFSKTLQEKRTQEVTDIVWPEMLSRSKDPKKFTLLDDGTFFHNDIHSKGMTLTQINQNINILIKQGVLSKDFEDIMNADLAAVENSDGSTLVTRQGDDCLLREPLAKAVTQAIREHVRSGGNEMDVSSCYRSPEHQAAECTWHHSGAENCLGQKGGVDAVLPGHSLHQGLAIDVMSHEYIAKLVKDIGMYGCISGDYGHIDLGRTTKKEGFSGVWQKVTCIN